MCMCVYIYISCIYTHINAIERERATAREKQQERNMEQDTKFSNKWVVSVDKRVVVGSTRAFCSERFVLRAKGLGLGFGVQGLVLT